MKISLWRPEESNSSPNLLRLWRTHQLVVRAGGTSSLPACARVPRVTTQTHRQDVDATPHQPEFMAPASLA
jgi:hypothetical protein